MRDASQVFVDPVGRHAGARTGSSESRENRRVFVRRISLVATATTVALLTTGVAVSAAKTHPKAKKVTARVTSGSRAPTTTTFTATKYSGTVSVIGGTGDWAHVTGKGTLTCSSPDAVHTSCTEHLKLKLPAA
jgi:hypothetical protein